MTTALLTKVLAAIGDKLTTVPKILRAVDIDNSTLGIILEELEKQQKVINSHHSVPIASPLWKSAYLDDVSGLAWPPGSKYPIVGSTIRKKQ